MAPRKFFVGGNWKMNGNKKEIEQLVDVLKKGVTGDAVEVVVGCPSIYLQHTACLLPSNISLAAQNCYKVPKGAFTGEISPAMIKDIGAPWVILGHSERRNVFGESDQVRASARFGQLEKATVFIIHSSKSALREVYRKNLEKQLPIFIRKNTLRFISTRNIIESPHV